MIVQDFKSAISIKYPPNEGGEEEADSMDAENALHRAYAANKARFFAGREKVLL